MAGRGKSRTRRRHRKRSAYRNAKRKAMRKGRSRHKRFSSRKARDKGAQSRERDMPPYDTITTLEWLKSNKRSRLRLSRYYRLLYPEETVRLPETNHIPEDGIPLFAEKAVRTPPGFCAVIPGGRVWGRNGTVLTPDNRLLEDVTWEFKRPYIVERSHTIFRKKKLNRLVRTSKTIGVAAHPGSSNYFHWLFDVLPRVHLLQRSGRHLDGYVFSGIESSYHKETLSMLGVSIRKTIIAEGRFHLQAKRLIVPSLTSRFSWSDEGYPQPIAYSRWTLQFLRKALLPQMKLPRSPCDRIYISRASAPRRRLANEEELVSLLEPLGFTVLQAETLSVAEQIGLFASARAVVAPHGAGLANLAFCRPGTFVVELLSAAYIPGFYRIISSLASLNYYAMTGKPVNTEEVSWPGAADFVIEPDGLAELLDAAGIAR